MIPRSFLVPPRDQSFNLGCYAVALVAAVVVVALAVFA